MVRLTLYSRLNDKMKGAIVIVMQRLHEDDLVGHVMKREGWEVLSFPAIAETDEIHVVDTLKGPQEFRRKAGAALHDEREPLATPARIRATIGRIQFRRPIPAGRPRPPGAACYRTNERPAFDRIVQSWDTANKPSELADYSRLRHLGPRGAKLLPPQRPAQKTLLPGAQARRRRADRPFSPRPS